MRVAGSNPVVRSRESREREGTHARRRGNPHGGADSPEGIPGHGKEAGLGTRQAVTGGEAGGAWDARLPGVTGLERPMDFEAATGVDVRAHGQHHVSRLGNERVRSRSQFDVGRCLDQRRQPTNENAPGRSGS